MTRTAPSPGDLVEVRRRQYIVQDVRAGAVVGEALGGPQHLVRLSSIEDDAMGEELEVVWEIEPGACITPGAAQLPAPEGLDEPSRFDAFLDAVRWGAIDSGDPKVLQSPFRAGIQIEDYQLDPVARALRMPRVNLLIADDVGLGKTIEAGLVIEEMMLRHRVRSVLVITPASVQIQWRDQMRDKFGLEFRIVDTQMLRDLRRRRGVSANPWTHFPRLITSIDFIKREEVLRRLREILPSRPTYPRPFDLMVVDEAHNVAPSRVSRYAVDSDRTRAVRELVPHFEHKLFLTATPHNGFRESWSALLALLDDQRFAPAVPPDPKQVEQVVVRRMKSELLDKDGKPRFPHRLPCHLEVDYPESEREAHRMLKQYAQLRRDAVTAAGEDGEVTAVHFVSKLLKKRLFSSPAAFLQTIEKHLRTLRGFEEKPAPKRSSVRLLRRELERVEDDFADDEELEEAQGEAVTLATAQFANLSAAEKKLLSDLRDWAARGCARPDAKATVLVRWLVATCKTDGEWNDERVIVFTEYRTTQKWLHGLFVHAGLGDEERLAVLHGGVDQEEREQIKAAFQASPREASLRILLATDAASEGIDLQNHCHRLVHYEIPWNPNRLEQRNGRIDRHGQRHAPLVHHFVPKGFEERLAREDWRKPGDLEGDLEFLAVAARKVENIREDLGSVGPVLVRQVEDAMFGKRSSIDTGKAEVEARETRKQLAFSRNLREQVARLHEQLAASRSELRVDADNVRSVVSTALDLAGQPPLEEATLSGVWPDPAGLRTRCPVFRVPALRPPWNRCLEGLAHPHSGAQRPVTFDHELVVGRDDVVLVHLEHPLVRMAQRLLRAEVWSPAGHRKLHRVTARRLAAGGAEGIVVLAHARLVVIGAAHQALHEELLVAGGVVKDGRFQRLQVTDAQELLQQVTDEAVPETQRAGLGVLWATVEQSLRSALEARMRERTRTLESRMAARAEEDVSRITAVLEQLADTIRTELDGTGDDRGRQLTFDWSKEEQEQWERNHDELRRRLDAIPEEIELESKRLRERYSDPRPLLFPVAVTWLLPQGAVVPSRRSS